MTTKRSHLALGALLAAGALTPAVSASAAEPDRPVQVAQAQLTPAQKKALDDAKKAEQAKQRSGGQQGLQKGGGGAVPFQKNIPAKSPQAIQKTAPLIKPATPALPKTVTPPTKFTPPPVVKTQPPVNPAVRTFKQPVPVQPPGQVTQPPLKRLPGTITPPVTTKAPGPIKAPTATTTSPLVKSPLTAPIKSTTPGTPLPVTRGLTQKSAPPKVVKAITDTRRIEDLRSGRRQTTIKGGTATIINESDKRVIVRDGGKVLIRHDPVSRFKTVGRSTRLERREGGVMANVVSSRRGYDIITETDRQGHVLRRYRRDRGGREIVLVDNRKFWRRALVAGAVAGIATAAIITMARPAVAIPRERYIVEYEDASEDELYDTFMAPPVEALPRRYSMEEIRYSHSLRERLRRVDLDGINFDTGSWAIDPSQYGKLERMARAMLRVIEKDESEMFFIEGHTDAVGTEEDNLTLSDRRAEAVSILLSEEFGVPPENMETQGYGEEFLKVDTQDPSRANRRVTVRRVTKILSRDEGDDRD